MTDPRGKKQTRQSRWQPCDHQLLIARPRVGQRLSSRQWQQSFPVHIPQETVDSGTDGSETVSQRRQPRRVLTPSRNHSRIRRHRPAGVRGLRRCGKLEQRDPLCESSARLARSLPQRPCHACPRMAALPPAASALTCSSRELALIPINRALARRPLPRVAEPSHSDPG